MDIKKSAMKGCLFAASNSRYGFKSYYSEIFEGHGYKKVYIIKGGPGTGKSRFMREVAKCAEDLGACVRYYACASDPDSLDGIIIDERIVILDGTPPHSCECRIAGARDEIIDLGAFWNVGALEEKADAIFALSTKKSWCYEKAYKYLAAYGEIRDLNSSLAKKIFKREKAEKAIDRLLSEFDDEEGFSIEPALVESIGMKGVTKLETFTESAEKLYYILDLYSLSDFYLSLLLSKAKEKNISVIVSYDPINPRVINSVYFCNKKIAFVTVSDGEERLLDATRINMKRFADADAINEIKREYKHNQKLCDALLESAKEMLARASESHFELEKIYSSCMDFSAKEKYTEGFCKRICAMLKS